ncbi:fibronectin type III domain-containing protein [Aeromicrobium terrae]|uniref:Fibronectin type III domain-containing protein n=1 Tax=Aeromicrobium terrae TaxID=2498846 RepID=A0A5C8NHQ3_9ACTN|nr:fibronectin type III domain-containing protein [Aeromicrobium terrae]TXL60682.1 fibronectin type III domain-containing protein [Aeromicrobium terrae]
MRRFLLVLGLTLALATPTAAHAADDTDTPVVVAATLSPTTVDVSTDDQQVQATLRITDATGVKAVSGRLEAVDSSQTTAVRFGVGILGTKTDGYWRMTFTIPQGATPGTWRLAYSTLDDAGNQGSSADVPVESLPIVDVTSVENPDADGPVLVSTEVSPTSVDVGPAAQDVTATYHVTDATGAAHVLTSLWAVGEGEATPNQQAELVDGTPQDGTWQTTFTIPKGAVAADWQVRILAMDDELGNVTSGILIPPSKLATVKVASSTAPDAPTGVHATAVDGGATVSWTAPDDNGLPITGYVVSALPGEMTKTVPGDQTSVAFDGLTNGTAYTFTVVAVNDVGPSDPSAPSNAATPNHVFETGPTATITGDVQEQAVLTAHEGTPSPAPSSFRYQWFSDGTPIDGATERTFEVTSAEVGHAITVMVTAHLDGYVDASDVSDPTGTIGSALDVATSKAIVQTGRTVRVTALGLQRREPYTVTIGGVLVKSYTASYSGTVSAYVRVPASLPDGPAEVKVTAASGRYGITSLYNAAPADFTVVPDDTSVQRGGATQVTVTGMAPNEPVRITFSGRTVSPRGAVADADGTYSQSVPVGTRVGARPLKAIGLYYQRTGVVTVTVTP